MTDDRGYEKGGVIMSTAARQVLKLATSGLTGRRERDIAYLKEQIVVFGADAQVVTVLKSILGSLMWEAVQESSV